MEENKNLEINLNLLVDMAENNVEITKVEVTTESGKKTFKELTMTYLSAQIEAKKKKMERYTSNLPDSELPYDFISKRDNARTEYDTLIETKLTLELFG